MSIRIFNAYGPRFQTKGAYGSAIGVFLKQKLSKKPLTVVGNGNQSSDYVHAKDVALRTDGERGILGSHLPFGDAGRGWEFRSVGRGDVDFDDIVRSLNRIGYDGPLSVEWEDEGMDRRQGAMESLDYLQSMDVVPPSGAAFDAAFSEQA